MRVMLATAGANHSLRTARYAGSAKKRSPCAGSGNTIVNNQTGVNLGRLAWGDGPITGNTFGKTSVLSSLIYVLVGISAIALVPTLVRWISAPRAAAA